MSKAAKWYDALSVTCKDLRLDEVAKRHTATADLIRACESKHCYYDPDCKICEALKALKEAGDE